LLKFLLGKQGVDVGKHGVVAAIIFFGALALLLPGCGSGDEGSATASGLTKAEFASQADAVCKKAQDEIVKKNFAQVRKLASNPKAREALEFKLVKTSVIPALEHEVEQLEALGEAPDENAQIEQMLKLIEGAIAEAKSEPETYVAGDSYRWGSEHFGKAHRLAVAYGIKNCPMAE
jgi:hypothetical protein